MFRRLLFPFRIHRYAIDHIFAVHSVADEADVVGGRRDGERGVGIVINAEEHNLLLRVLLICLR